MIRARLGLPLALTLGLAGLVGCGAPPPSMTPQQICAKSEPMAEAWRVADGQDAATPERAALSLKACETRWTEQQGADPSRYRKTAACIDKATKYEAIEQCVIDNLPVQ
ncbi:MAG: hypothetical protein R3B09_02560 [Nannocystaceae bacterium]